MGEEDILAIEGNGYSYWNGAILDNEGNYLPSLELNGITYKSELDEQTFTSWKSSNDRLESEDSFSNLQQFEDDPLYTTLTEQDKDYYDSYRETKLYNDEDTYDNVEDFQKENEKIASENVDDMTVSMMRQFQTEGYDQLTDEHINAYKENEKVIKHFQETDADVDSIMNDILNEKDTEDKNIFTQMGDWMWDKIYTGVKYITPTGVGMDGNDEEKEAYKEAIKKRKELQTPVLEITKKIIDERKDKLQSMWDEMSFSEKYNPLDKDNRLIEWSLGEIKKESDRVEDYLEGAWVYNPINKDFMGDMATLGIGDAYDMYFYNAYLNKKITNGEPLTEKEKLAAETIATINQTHGIKMEQKGFYGISEGTSQSIGFLVGGSVGRLAMKGVAKAVTRGVAKAVIGGLGTSAKTGVIAGKFVNAGVNMFGQAVLHPQTYVQGLQKYYGDITFDTDDKGEVSITTDRRTYKTLKKEMELAKDSIENALSIETDNEKIKVLNLQLEKINSSIKSLKEPSSAFDAAAYGFTEVLKENFTEEYLGKIVNTTGNKIFGKLKAKPWVNKLTQSKIAKNISKLDNFGSSVKAKYNNLMGTSGGKILGGNFEEIGEELATQFMPVWGETDKEAADRKQQVFEADFYKQIVGQTLLMSGVMKGVYSPISGYNMYKNSKNLKDKRKAFKQLIKDFKQEGISDAKVEELLMSAGTGNFTVQEYNNKIQDLRNKGKHSEANDIERNKYFNIGKSFVNIGQGKKFIREMNSLLAKGKLPAESISNVKMAINEVQALHNDMEEHQGLRNSGYVLELKSKLRYNDNQKNKIKEEISKVESEEQTEDRDNRISILKEALADIDANGKKLSKVIDTETSPKKVEKLKKEAEVTKALLKEYKYFKNLELKGDKKFQEENKGTFIKEAIESIKDKYGRTVSSGSYKQAIKDFNREVLKDVVNEEMINLSNQEAKTTESINEEIPEDKKPIVEHLNEVAENINEVTDILEHQDPDIVGVVDKLDYAGPQEGQDMEGYYEDGKKDSFDPDEAFFDDMPVDKNGNYENKAFNNLVNAVKKRAKFLSDSYGKKATFEDYIEDLISEGEIPLDNLRGHMRALALAWSGAKLGKNNWKQLYNTLFEDTKEVMKKSEERPVKVDKPLENKKVEEIRKESSEIVDSKTSFEPIKYESGSNKPIHSTPNSNKTYGTEHKLNYSILKFKEIEEEVDGKKVYKVVNDIIPQMNENSSVKAKNLANPNMNNIGDVLKPQIIEKSKLGNTLVAFRDEYGRKLKLDTFENWVKENKPKDVSFEDFQKTKEYMDKVPMVYVDATGSPVAYVPEVDWFSPLTVGDRTKEVDEIDLDNLSTSLKEDIKENKEKASQLREDIITGKVKEVEIVDNLSHPPLQIIPEFDNEGNRIPAKKLNEVAPDSELVWMRATGGLYDLQDNKINSNDIINIGDDEAGFLKAELIENENSREMLPINRNRIHYLSHFATVNGVKKYIALNAFRKNENGENQATEEDITTARIIAAANNILQFSDTESGINTNLKNPKHPFSMSLEQAEDIRRQVKEQIGLDIKSEYSEILESLIAYQPIKGNKESYASKFSKELIKFNKNTNQFANTSNRFVQNTKLKYSGKGTIKISNNEGNFKVEKIAETYDKHLKNRLSTNVMGYNVGTKENPVYTVAAKQKIKLQPKVIETSNIEKNIEENKTKAEVVNKVAEVNKVDKIENTEERNKAIENATALAKELNLDIRPIEEIDDMIVSEMTTTKEIENSISITEGLTISQEEDIIKWMFSKLAKTDNNFDTVLQDISKDFELKKEKLLLSIKELSNYEDNEVVKNLKNTLENAVKQIDKVLENKNKLLTEASLRAVNSSFITDEFEEVENEKDYSKKSNETKPIDKVGTALKRIFAQINNGKTGFMGLETYTSFKQMYDTVSLSLSSDINLTPNFNQMMALLKKRKDSTEWMPSLIEKLESADEQVKNQFVYNAYKQKVYAKFATLSFNKKKQVQSRIFDSNANEAKRAVIDSWKENFKRSPINNDGKINTVVLKEIVAEWDKWFDKGRENQSNETYKNWLSKFGINLSDKTIDALRKGDLNVSESGGKLKKVEFKELFKGMTGNDSSNRTGLLFTNLAKYALLNENKKDLEFYSNTKNHPFDEMSTILNQLAELETQFNPNFGSTSRYIAGKSVTEIEAFTYFYEQFKKLKSSALTDKKYLEDLKLLSFSKDSYLLDLLMTDEVFANQFNHGLVDLMSLKELHKKSPMFASIDELSSLDYMFTQRTMFQDRKQGSDRKLPNSKFSIRMAHINTLTNSDKGRMMLMKTAVFDLYKQSEKAFNIVDGKVSFTEDLQDLLFKNLIAPELRRMINFKLKVNKTNIKNYDKGAVRFNLLPGLNSITNSNNQSIFDIIENTDKKDVDSIMKEVTSSFSKDINLFLQNNILKEAKENVKKVKQFDKKGVDTFNNANYISQREGSISENMLIAELDFTINSMITNMNYMQLMAGDPALYYKSKEKLNTKDLKVETKISQQLAINLGKRMASMIAPGSVLADSDSNSYMQIFLEDINSIADNILDIVEWHYSKKELNEKYTNGLTYKEMFEEVKKGNREYIKLLSSRFDKVAEFIDIESTDAQEYTTLKEHLYVMEKQGRISSELKEKIEGKIKKGEDLTKEELGIVLQPIKPVYTGTVYDVKQDVNRMMYIKSSSFPLIPQLTKGRKLDDLRKRMEEVEEAYKTTVRASYQTANKVGALTSENTIKDFNQPIVANNMLKLPRKHFKIQQDVPFKSKKVQDDVVSMGTQIFKLLMGDGIMDLDGFEYEGKILNGKELHEEFHKVFKDIINLKKDKFLSTLGLESDMSTKDSQKTIQKLQKLLIKEAKSRGFSKQDLKILSLVDDKNGNKTFKLPLWMTGNSNKYESMLNALINNKIFKQKLPGNKFVTGSEAGFEVKEDYNSVDKSRIIHIGDFTGKELQSTRNSEGGITKAQIYVPSKFKLNGKLIDLFEEFNGEEGVYLHRVNGVLKIKEHMVDKNLLEQFVFRIPTSSHGLGSSIEVVGFLPPESGDLIITPKGFIAQMGQDFDIDSLTAYQYHHLVMEDGSIRELTEENKEYYINEKRNLLETLQNLVNKGLLNSMKEASGELKDFEVFGIDFIQDEESVLNEIKEIKENLNKDFDLKLLENKFIKIHNSVYSNKASQKHINKVLSMSFAEKQADDIESLTLNTKNTFNILSPVYQMNKMNAGSTGQTAIGIYAKGVTLHSLIQQEKSLGNEIRLGKEGIDETTPKFIKIGNLVSDGTFGRMFSLKSQNLFSSLNRKISTILDERTNTGTDNEKAQILGRTGLNHSDAIAVDNLLSLLGFDAEYTQIKEEEYKKGKPFHRETVIDGKKVFYLEHSIPYLLHSQPIIKEYFSIINEKESITTEFSGKAKEEALNELIRKYGDKDHVIQGGKLGKIKIEGEKEIFISNQDNSKFNSKMLQNQIILNEKSDKISQLEILALYVDLSKDAKKVKTMMQHIDLNNLGKSMWESSTKAKEFKDFFLNTENSGIIGAKHLIGNIEVNDRELKPGEIDLGDLHILTPKSNQGVMVGTALSLSEALFTNLFPAKNKYINEIIESIFLNSNINIDNSFAVVKAKEQIFQEIKKYLTSAKGLGLFDKQAKDVRANLFIDDFKNNHLSLSTYVSNLLKQDSSEYNLDKVKNNLFLNMLKTTYGENGKPSLITFNNQESFEANQEAIYASFKELIAEEITLPRKNGEYYSTRILAQELIAYSYVSGGIVQGAVEFHKFLPIEYLDDMGRVNSKGTKISVSERLRSFNTFNKIEGSQSILGRFERQYFQNNPQSALQIKMNEVITNEGESFFTPKEPTVTKYIAKKISTDSKLKQDKWALYERVENQMYYREIPVLGEMGMSEYDFGIEENTSILGNKDFKSIEISELEYEVLQHSKLKEIPKDKTSIKSFLKEIQSGKFETSYENIKDIAEYLFNFVKDDAVINYTEGNYKGRYKSGEMYINPNNISTREEFATTFVHEVLHTITSPYINQFLKNGELNLELQGIPNEIISLNNVMKEYRNQLATLHLNDKINPQGYKEFKDKWKKYKEDRAANLPKSVDFSPEELSIYYPSVNLKEFLATALGNNREFKQVAKNMEYLKSGNSILRKFGHFITNLLKKIGKNEGIKENSIALQAILKSSDLIESINNKKMNIKKKVETNPKVSKQEVLDAKIPTVHETPNLGDPSQDSGPTLDLLPMEITKNECK